MLRRSKQSLGVCIATVLSVMAPDALAGDRLGWTGAVTQVEGSAGGGVVPWALIGGLGTADQFGASGFVTYLKTQDFSLRSYGFSAAAFDRVEVSVAQQRLDAGSVIPNLTLGQDIVGVKFRVLGDAVFDQDSWVPQLAVGAQWKRTLDFGEVPQAVGAAHGADVDAYVAATKIFFAAVAGRNVILDATLRRTRADQFGLLGFGGGAGGYRYEPEVSAAIWLADDWLLGAEYRDKPSDLPSLREDSAKVGFLAYQPVKNCTLTAAWVDLGAIAGKPVQHGIYVSLWVGI